MRHSLILLSSYGIALINCGDNDIFISSQEMSPSQVMSPSLMSSSRKSFPSNGGTKNLGKLGGVSSKNYQHDHHPQKISKKANSPQKGTLKGAQKGGLKEFKGIQTRKDGDGNLYHHDNHGGDNNHGGNLNGGQNLNGENIRRIEQQNSDDMEKLLTELAISRDIQEKKLLNDFGKQMSRPETETSSSSSSSRILLRPSINKRFLQDIEIYESHQENEEKKDEEDEDEQKTRNIKPSISVQAQPRFLPPSSSSSTQSSTLSPSSSSGSGSSSSSGSGSSESRSSGSGRKKSGENVDDDDDFYEDKMWKDVKAKVQRVWGSIQHGIKELVNKSIDGLKKMESWQMALLAIGGFLFTLIFTTWFLGCFVRTIFKCCCVGGAKCCLCLLCPGRRSRKKQRAYQHHQKHFPAGGGGGHPPIYADIPFQPRVFYGGGGQSS